MTSIDQSLRRQGRPCGVTVAILAGIFLFSLLPLLQVGMVLIVRQHFASLDFPEDGPQPMATGGNFLGGITEAELALQGALSLGFLAVAVMAWRGRPALSRQVFVLAVAALTLVKLTALALQPGQAAQEGITSGDTLFQSLGVGQVAIEILVMLYIIWYMNRAPARAFFRGQNPPRPDRAADEFVEL